MRVERNSNNEIGPSRLRYIATHYARQLEEPNYEELPVNETTRQLERIDRETTAIENERRGLDTPLYVPIRVMLNGQPVVLDFNIGDLRKWLGLPEFDLYPGFRSPMDGFVPSSNIPDVDHNNSDND
ncbi:hypothetical protein AC1031_008069 [Aphanomyces cochlioides]|nr:hypothetical protein AC1031_008069 [Aphanomyces cochlioides]